MEIKINKEIREYTESIFFGLSLRQFLFSVLACLTTILLYYISKTYFGKETISWICIVGASPFAILGFFKYNGMPAEKVIWNYIKSEILTPKTLKYEPKNYYYELLKDKLEGADDNENIENVI